MVKVSFDAAVGLLVEASTALVNLLVCCLPALVVGVLTGTDDESVLAEDVDTLYLRVGV